MPKPFRQQNANYTSVSQAWKSWPCVSVTLYNLPNKITTHALWKAFQMQGNLVSIDIFEDKHGNPISKGRIRFSPAPYFAFWERGPYHVKLDGGGVVKVTPCVDANFQEYFVQSPARANELRASQLEVGVQRDVYTISPLKAFTKSVRLRIDVQERALYIYFNEMFPVHGPKADGKPDPKKPPSPVTFRLKIPFSQLNKVWEAQGSPLGPVESLHLLLFLDYPVICHRKLSNPATTFTGDLSWREGDSWMRQTRITHDDRRQGDTTTNLRTSGHVINIGRWNVFKVTLPANDINMKARALINDVLKDHNILVQNGNHFQEFQGKTEPVWQWIDGQMNPEWSMLGDLADQHSVQLPFPVRYQLEVCISHGRLSEFNMTRDFVIRLMSLGETKARRLLEHVATHKSNYLNPMEIFKIKVVKGATDSKIPEYCCFMRTARITPTTVYYNTPTVDTSNRITRRYIEFVDRFLRVRFSDEMYLGPVRASINGVEDEVYKRIKATLARGIIIGGRHYEFLAFGNSQFREQGAYFFASVPNLSAAHIRAWMGQFSHIRNIAKHTSRLGQCFSTTRAVGTCVVHIKQIPDIERNGYVFSDGVGKISKFLAQMATNNLKIRTPNGEPPSAFQFRLGGCKGMLVVSSDPQPSELHIRPSQQKFESPHGGLEIIRWSSNSMATLNRQLILILAALGISMRVILEKQNAMLQSFNKAMTDDSQAVSLLQRFVDPNHTTLTLADLVHDGFRRVNEPFVISTLSLWKAWHFKYLKEKAKIVIEKGANLFGVLDETGLLQGWFDENVKRAEQPNAGIIDKIAALPEVFVQISPLEKSGQPKVIESICILARNPSLHPGDIRVVRAVNEPKLRHLMDVIVFPQTGDRDLASMCSGGDLDGDDYLIMWDPDLISDKWFTKPMADNNEVAPELDRDVTVDDMTSFFVTYMKNNCLPRIASAHMAWADRLDLGVQEEKCIRLASMHSAAVDYNKTGRATKMTWNLEPKQWPHFMGKKRSTYHSTKVLGRLYDAVETIHFVPDLSVPFDSRILECDLVPVSESFMVFATRLKKEYDAAMLRIMAQFEIKTEFEVWSTFVLNHSRVFRDFKLHEDLGHIASTLRNGFRQQCFNHVGGRGLEDIAPLVVAMYRVTHEAKTEVLERLREGPTHYDDDDLRDDGSETGSNGENAELPLISFPWIFHEYLGKIATGQFKKDKLETCKDQQSFGKIFTHAEVQKVLVEVEQEGDQAIVHGEDDKIRTEMTNAAFEKMLATIDVQNSETDEIEVKEVLVETPDNLSNLGTVDSGIGLSFSTERIPDDDVPLMTFEEDGDEGDRTDGVETIIQEIVETESSIPQSMLKQLLSLVGA